MSVEKFRVHYQRCVKARDISGLNGLLQAVTNAMYGFYSTYCNYIKVHKKLDNFVVKFQP